MMEDAQQLLTATAPFKWLLSSFVLFHTDLKNPSLLEAVGATLPSQLPDSRWAGYLAH